MIFGRHSVLKSGRSTWDPARVPQAEVLKLHGCAHSPPRDQPATSFAAPLVARLLAARLDLPEAGAAARALDALVREAIDLGPPGRDPGYGWGLVGESR